jgi:hypothetical protein
LIARLGSDVVDLTNDAGTVLSSLDGLLEDTQTFLLHLVVVFELTLTFTGY